MRKLSVTVLAAAAIFLVGSLACKADVATSNGTALPKAAKNFSPVEPAACRGFGEHCPPGFVWTCGGGRCWCRPCR
jgi:hypothetical protein